MLVRHASRDFDAARRARAIRRRERLGGVGGGLEPELGFRHRARFDEAVPGLAPGDAAWRFAFEAAARIPHRPRPGDVVGHPDASPDEPLDPAEEAIAEREVRHARGKRGERLEGGSGRNEAIPLERIFAAAGVPALAHEARRESARTPSPPARPRGRARRDPEPPRQPCIVARVVGVRRASAATIAASRSASSSSRASARPRSPPHVRTAKSRKVR